MWDLQTIVQMNANAQKQFDQLRKQIEEEYERTRRRDEIENPSDQPLAYGTAKD